MDSQRICVIGAGPAGMMALYKYNELDSFNKPEVVCYEKQSEWGGMWTYSWKTGTDEFGELCHNGMYRGLWTNLPKECLELPYYTLQEHYGKPVPSYLPRNVMKDYMDGLWNRPGKDVLFNYVKFNHAVRFVKCNETTKDFTVTVSDLKNQKMKEENFSHVVVAAGIFSTPHKPDFPGIECFKGRVIHSHDLRNPEEFKDQAVLVIGGSTSARDVSVQLIKNGAELVIVSHSNPSQMVKTWPDGIHERQIVSKIHKRSATFKDDTSAEFDAIILCTGYLNSFPYLEQKLQLTDRTSSYPDNLYKGIIWMPWGYNRLYYIGTLKPYFTLPMLDLQTSFMWQYITGKLNGEPKTEEEMSLDVKKWRVINAVTKDIESKIEFQAKYLIELNEITRSIHKIKDLHNILTDVVKKFQTHMGTYRDSAYASVYTRQMSILIRPWMENHNESIRE